MSKKESSVTKIDLKKMRRKKLFGKLYLSDLIFALVIISIIIFYSYRIYFLSDTYDDVAKVYNIEVRRHSVHFAEYEYFVNNIRYTGDEKIDSRNDKKYFNRCFRVEISKKNPTWSKINLKKEIFNHKKND